MNRFEQICESVLPSTMKVITRVRYPKQIKFSEEFVTALNKEFARLQTLEENQDPENSEVKPIRNYKEKFLKAINFCVSNY